MIRSTQWIAHAVNGTVVGREASVTGPVITDSRLAEDGSLYIARRGENSDGHAYVASARKAGSVAAIVERADELADDPDFPQIVVDDSTLALGRLAHAHLEDLRTRGPLDVIAVTGSAGKTTTKDLLRQILGRHAPTVGPKLSFNNEVGLPLTVLQADETTRHLVLEMGASGLGHIDYLTSIASPDVAIVLMVGHAHLGGFGSVEGIAQAKAEIIRGSREGATAILNVHDPYVAAMASQARGPVVTFSADPKIDADVRAESIRCDGSGRPTFVLVTPEGRGEVTLALVGEHNVHNALAAAAGARAVGLDFDTIVTGLGQGQALSPHRLTISDIMVDGHPVTLVDDAYNANVDSMRAGFQALEHVGRGRRKIAVLSQMLELGEASASTHRDVGRMAQDAGVDTLIALGDEDARGYLDGAGTRVSGTHVSTVDEAVDAVLSTLTDSAVVFVKGSYGSHSWMVADALSERDQSTAVTASPSAYSDDAQSYPAGGVE
ncbi:UDP-N-acetylmuramoyl-tripeptide--D-alanyl-D-alanine ligase [Schaalia sp. ZJ1691]|uniref:UDP-N-acetylmuramoyl-tripeptide--D-alanyl-D- alanine ligase n=1 Tax=Schaalia sp. ZJ1691 TaxID=2709404 RepID=UPI0013ECC276|nr:UDP-N-acetylmuramoyl-tripeptide--D-alanyl-D-alanine ligase [Schaalia sp. ZJ1691]